MSMRMPIFLTLLRLLSAASPPFNKIYAFGDSFTDTGNTRTSTGPTAFNYVSNPPYGTTFFHHPTNRYCDGRIVVDFVANALSLPFIPPYRNPNADQSHGVNFAVGGATAIRHGFFLRNNVTFNLVPQSLQTQLVWFNKILATQSCVDMETTPKQCKSVLGNALIWVGEIGANDYTCTLGSPIPKSTVRTIAIRSVIGFLKAIIKKGATRIVVQGLPPAGCSTYSFSLASPDDRDETGCVASTNMAVSRHNVELQAQLELLRKESAESVIVYADYYNAYMMLLKNASKYGFKEKYRVCCGYGGGEYNFNVFNTCGSPSTTTSCRNPAEYLNWDGAHFTEAANKVLANAFVNGTYCNPPFTALFTA